MFDSQVAFDNDQVVARSWQVRTDNKVNAIIETSACVTPLQQQSLHQFNTALHPRNWFNYDGVLEKLALVRHNEGDYYDSVHNTHCSNAGYCMNPDSSIYKKK